MTTTLTSFPVKKPAASSTSATLYRVTAAFLVLEFLCITIPTAGLGIVFQFPGILDQPGSYVLPLFQAQRASIIPLYYVFMLSGALLIPLALLLQRLLAPGQEIFVRIATAFGIVTGITQMLGFIRWSFLIPYLADLYTASQTSTATRQLVSIVYDAFNFYAGHAVGEHLGFLFNILWGAMIGIAMLHSPLFRRWIGWTGLVFSLGVLAEILQLFMPSLQPQLELVFIVSYSLWTIWLVIVAAPLMRTSFARRTNTPVSSSVTQ